ncbi:MAG: hypothetical protein H0T46_00795 [Deltaproteobacteria bacterium]|nr:hypothetical protein [Deltaproteobacteria bacterium]
MSNSTSESDDLPTTSNENTEAPAAKAEAPQPERHVNSVDATAHQPLVARVMERKHELETLLAALDTSDVHSKQDIEAALGAVEPMLSGDLDNVAAVVMVDLNRWLERSKHLGERNVTASVAEPAAEPAADPVAEPSA